jgi:hypothetical protein
MRYFYHVQLFEITRAYKIKSPEPLAKPLFPGIKTESDGARIRIGARTPFYFASASPNSKNRATLLNSSTCFEAATLRISKVEHLIALAQSLPSVPRLRASTLFGRRPTERAASLGVTGVQKPVQVRSVSKTRE